MAVRFLARLARVRGDDAMRAAIDQTLAVVTRKDAVEDRGRMVGDLTARDRRGARRGELSPHPALPRC